MTASVPASVQSDRLLSSQPNTDKRQPLVKQKQHRAYERNPIQPKRAGLRMTMQV